MATCISNEELEQMRTQLKAAEENCEKLEIELREQLGLPVSIKVSDVLDQKKSSGWGNSQKSKV